MRRLLSAFLAVCLFFPATLADCEVTASGRITLLRNREYGEALLQGIRKARESVLLSFYLFKVGRSHDNMPAAVADELIKARKRGVNVTVFLEKSDHPEDSLNLENRKTAAILNHEGIKVFFDSPRVTTHTKAVIIDSHMVYLGSHNLTQNALRYNNELSVLIDSPEVAAAIKAYLERL